MKNLKPLFLPYELSTIAKEKGFNKDTLGYYSRKKLNIGVSNNKETTKTSGDCAAPLYQQIVDWFREEPRFIQILEKTERFGFKEPMYCVKERGKYATGELTLNEAIKEAFKLM